MPDSPEFDPDDITTWDAAQLDELGLWQAEIDGAEIVDEPEHIELPEHGEHDDDDDDEVDD